MASRRRSHGAPAPAIALTIALSLGAAVSAAATPSFDGKGRVVAVDPARRTVTIEHEGVPGLHLPASQSEFTVQSVAVIGDVRPGERVRFTLDAADESHGLLTLARLTPEAMPAGDGLDRVLVSAAAIFGFLALAAAATMGVLLARDLRRLHRRLSALDHEAGMLRGLVTETQDGVHLIARALDEAAAALRVGYVQELRRRLVAVSGPVSADGTGDPRSNASGRAFVIVQRGRGDLYRAVEGSMTGAGVTVIWDRRRSERRRNARRSVGPERRHADRRGAPPETWTRLGFQLVPTDATDGAVVPPGLPPGSREPSLPR
jgi:Cu(I)/Ag(I) efflux system protein CusF